MVEGTRGIDFLFGVIIAVVASNWIAQHVHTEGAGLEVFIALSIGMQWRPSRVLLLKILCKETAT